MLRSMKHFFARGLFRPGIAMCSWLLLVSTTQAYPIDVAFSGLVSDVSGPLSGRFAVPQSMDARFTFNYNGENSPTGVYHGVITSLTVNFANTYKASFDPGGANSIRLTSNPGVGEFDSSWTMTAGAKGAAVNGFTPMEFSFYQEGIDLFSGSVALLGPSIGGAITSTGWRLIFKDGNGDVAGIEGTVKNLTVVPLPAAVVLFGAGLVSLVGLGAGGLRNSRKHQA